MPLTAQHVKDLAADCGFELAGVTRALPHTDVDRFEHWRASGYAGEMRYMTDHRGDIRSDPRYLLPAARTIVCVAKLYNAPEALPAPADNQARISRYAWGRDYHEWMRAALTGLAGRIAAKSPGKPLEWRACVDTAPLLERSYAYAAGLGWIGKNTCLINQEKGSWFFLGELLLSVALTPDTPPASRCGTCTRCIDACPTKAIVPGPSPGEWTLDARRCISYLTIEKRGPLDPSLITALSNHVFGCDICQDVCPWNRRAPATDEPAFQQSPLNQDLPALAQLDAAAFRDLFRHSPVWRAKYEGFLRNVALAMGNSGRAELLTPLEQLSTHPHALVAQTAREAHALLCEKLALLGTH